MNMLQNEQFNDNNCMLAFIFVDKYRFYFKNCRMIEAYIII